jgi:hypothetical protein
MDFQVRRIGVSVAESDRVRHDVERVEEALESGRARFKKIEEVGDCLALDIEILALEGVEGSAEILKILRREFGVRGSKRTKLVDSRSSTAGREFVVHFHGELKSSRH